MFKRWMRKRWTIEFRCRPGAEHKHHCPTRRIRIARGFWTEMGATREATRRNKSLHPSARANYVWRVVRRERS